jgi:hypothetical protein
VVVVSKKLSAKMVHLVDEVGLVEEGKQWARASVRWTIRQRRNGWRTHSRTMRKNRPLVVVVVALMDNVVGADDKDHRKGVVVEP